MTVDMVQYAFFHVIYKRSGEVIIGQYHRVDALQSLEILLLGYVVF